MIWAAYERVSTEEQASEGHSIEVQKEAIERYLKTKGDQLYRHYTDAGLSGASRGTLRPSKARRARSRMQKARP